MNRSPEEENSRRIYLDAALVIALYLLFVSIPCFGPYAQEEFTSALRMIFVLPCTLFLLKEGFSFAKGNGKRILLCLPFLLICFGNIVALLASGGSLSINRDTFLGDLFKSSFTSMAEELVFRAALLFALKKSRILGKWAIPLSALIFGLSHLLPALSGASIVSCLITAGYTTFLGLILGVAYEFGGLFPAILIHFLFNFFQTDIYLSSDGGNWDSNFWVFNAIFGILTGIYAVFVYFFLLRKKTK